MKLTFIGAAHEVTGSCHLLQACGRNILIDCGMEQGPDLYENQELPVNAGDIDYVLLTHAHIDHSGKLPLLAKEGFRGEIITTFATADLCDIMLRDSAHIQEFEAEWRNRKARRSGAEIYEPMYTMADADAAIRLLAPCDYNQRITLCEGIEVRFTDVGHLLGSACIEIWINEDGVSKKIVFSGDVGNLNQPIIKDPQYVKEADYVVIESTYGDRTHGDKIPDYVGEFTRILKETFDKGGNVVIPSFAVGRTQEILYFIREIKEKNRIPEYPDFPGYQPYTPEEANTLPPENIPPPPPEDYIPEEEAGPPPTPPYEVPTAPNIQVQPKRSPFEAYELALLRYIVRYGERVLYDYVDEETNEHVIMRVADYIRFDLERDDLTFYTPAFKQMLDEAAEHCQNEGFMASRYFLAHPDPNISRLAANLISDKYQLSKYHTKFRELEQEEDKLDYLVPREIYSMKDAYILHKIKDIQAKIKEAQNKGSG